MEEFYEPSNDFGVEFRGENLPKHIREIQMNNCVPNDKFHHTNKQLQI